MKCPSDKAVFSFPKDLPALMCENGALWVQQKGQKVIYVFVRTNMERNLTAGPELMACVTDKAISVTPTHICLISSHSLVSWRIGSRGQWQIRFVHDKENIKSVKNLV